MPSWLTKVPLWLRKNVLSLSQSTSSNFASMRVLTKHQQYWSWPCTEAKLMYRNSWELSTYFVTSVWSFTLSQNSPFWYPCSWAQAQDGSFKKGQITQTRLSCGLSNKSFNKNIPVRVAKAEHVFSPIEIDATKQWVTVVYDVRSHVVTLVSIVFM